MILSRDELIDFLILHGAIDSPEKWVSQIDARLVGFEFSDQFDNVFYIQKVDSGYTVVGKGRLKNLPLEDLKQMGRWLRRNLRRLFSKN